MRTQDVPSLCPNAVVRQRAGGIRSRPLRRLFPGFVLLVAAVPVVISSGGCPAPGAAQLVVVGTANFTDPSNGGASYVGTLACANCHADVGALHRRHAHAQALVETQGAAPEFLHGAQRPSIENPPGGLAWIDVPWVIGGHAKYANFVGSDGFLLRNSALGADAAWTPGFGPNGASEGFVPFDAAGAIPVDFDCFRCHVTGPMAPSARFEESRVGFGGVWAEAGVQCEACHGPGGRHFSFSQDLLEINKSAIHLDTSGDTSCNLCHSRPYDASDGPIIASDGFIASQQQSTELKASGGHSGFACTICHDPHRSLVDDRARAIRNECVACHTNQNMALHEGRVFRRADGYEEALTCESCHMPYASRAGTSAQFGLGRVGDVRTHIFRISTEPLDFQGLFNAEGSVARDVAGRAAVTVDFVCLRCHNDTVDGLFSLSVERAAEIGFNLHGDFSP